MANNSSSNERGRPGRPTPDQGDDRLEESLPPRRPDPENLERQTSFAREFFSSSNSSGLTLPDVHDRELAAALAASASIHDSGGSDSPKSWMEDARRQQPGAAGAAIHDSDGGAMQDARQGEEWASSHEILEQYRIMAEHEAHLRLKNMPGFDMAAHEKSGPTVAKIDDGYRKAMLTPMLPEPRRVNFTGSMPELKEPELPTLSRKHIEREYRREIVPKVHPGTIVSSGEEVPPGEKSMRCLGCEKTLRVQQRALYASCPNCSAESPAIAMHQPVSV